MSGDGFPNSLQLLYTYGVVERIRNTLSSGDAEGLEGFRGRMDECFSLFADNYPRLIEYMYSGDGVWARKVATSLLKIRTTACEVEDLVAIKALTLQEVPAITPQGLSDLFPSYKRLFSEADAYISSKTKKLFSRRRHWDEPTKENLPGLGNDSINQFWSELEQLLQEGDLTDTVAFQTMSLGSYPYLLCAPSLHRITEGRGASCRYYGEIWSLPDGETIVGLDSQKEEIIQWIFNDNPSNQCPNVISIEGEAGAGKTTLTKMIYNDVAFQASPSFDLLLWVLSRPLSSDLGTTLRATLVEIIRSLTNQRRSDLQRMEVQKLKSTLHDILAGKKYLLVLDDYKEVFDRELLYIILKVGLAGSTVILVSAEQVSEATKRWELPRLPERDSWSLFARCAGFDEEWEKDDPSFMTRIGRSINENCHGCPQAIKTLGSLLLNNRDEISWRGVKARSMWPTLIGRYAASNAFHASVEQMSADLLHCLYAFSIMSNNKAMPKDQLIFSWMALGLLHTRDEIRDPVVIGERYCDELASRCIVQLFQRDGLPMVLLIKQAVSLQRIIHHVEFASPGLLPRKHDRYLIWWGNEILMDKYLAEDFSIVTTFQFQNHVGALSKHFLRKLISRMKCARVLMLDGSEFAKLPVTIGTLKLLKYLSVAGNAELRELPESICSLLNLQTLDLSGCYGLQTLPRNMHKLVSLRHLFLSTSLTELPELPWASLHHLRICSSPNLSSLPEQIPPLTALRVLQIHDCPEIASLPDVFLGGLPSLQEISILNCDLLDLTNWRGLRVLMRLDYLHIQGLPKLSNFPEGLHSVAHSLRHFVVSNCRSLISLPEDLESCRNLVEMVIENCANLATLPKGIHEMTLQVLKIIKCPKLITRCKRGVGDDWHLISHIPKIQLDHQVYQPGYVPRASERVEYSKAGTSSQQESYNSSEISEIMSNEVQFKRNLNPSYCIKHFDRSRAVPLPYTYGVLKRICDMATSLSAENFVKDLNDVFVEFRSVYSILFKCIYSGDGEHAKGVVTCLDRLRTVAYDTEDLVAINQFYQQELPSTSSSLTWYSRNLCDSIAELRDSFRVLADIVRFQGSSPVQFLFDPDESAASSLFRGASCRFYGEIWSLPDGETIVGLDSQKEEIIRWIFNDNPSNQCPKFISIQGAAGAGKTTLARMIYNQVSTSFDLRLWALAPPTSSDLRATMVEILRYSTNQSRSDLQRMDRRSLEQKLYGVLSGKKYLLVLDVHSTDEHLRPADWAELCQILAVGLAGSTVIITTFTGITTKCFQVQGLQEDDCWSLFAQSAGFEEEEEKTHPSFLSSIGKSLIGSCVGNPRKIKTLGGVLRNKRDELFWKQIEDIRILQPKMDNPFEISAKHMSCELLHCLYLSFYLYTCTRDNVISRDKLIHCWMAMDLLHSRDKAEDPIDIGSKYCEELASRCFFQLFHSDGHAMVLLQKPDEMFGRALPEVELLPYEEHGFDRFRAALPPYEVRLISENKHSVIWSDHLRRSLGTNQFEGQTRSFPDKLISRMKYARVLLLDGSEFARLPETIGTLKILKYLSVAGNAELIALPESICSLPNLQTLDLSGCWGLQTLPRNMHKLVSLRHLFLSTSLTKLPELPWASLHHLRICISPKLSSLPEQIPPLSALKVLQIHDCPEIASLPGRFLGGLPSLQEISILNCDLLDLTNWSGLKVLMRLEYLHIQGLPKLSNFPEGLHSVAHSLRHFVVSNCQSLTSLPGDLRSCRNLVEMVIENCSNLATLPKGIHEMTKKVLKIINCPKLVEKPQTTVFVGKIATTVENDFMLSLLQFCGAVKSWKRPQDPSNGTPKAFGFCEFESAEGALRAVRLLSKVNIDGQELVLNVAKKKETPKPTETEEKGTKEGETTKVEKTEGDEKTEQPKPGEESGSKEDDTGGLLSDEDREADREATEKIANTIEERLRNRPPPLPLKLDVTATPNSEGPARSAEKDSDIDVKKDPSELQDTAVLKEVNVVEESEDPCSIFLLLPEDYEIEKDKLIQLWMAGEWINDEQHGDELFSSFFQNGYLSHCSSNLEIGKARYKIVAQKIKALCDRQKSNAESIRHVSLGCNAEIDAKTFKAIEMFTQLRTLLFLGNRDHGAIQIPRHLFSVFNHLVTLDLSGTCMKELPSSIEHIRGLRYLDLSWTLIEWLPDILCTLVQLQTLKLRGCYNLTVLPENLHQLTKLRHLDFDVLGQLEIMPPKMGKLVDLRTLPAFLVGTGDGRKILELNKVNSLSGELCIANLENVENGDEAKAAALTNKEHLKTLELRWTSSEICGMHDNNEVILDKLEPSKKLEELKITCYEGESFPGWIEDPDFCNLTSIVLYRCENLLYFPVVEQLPKLKHLRLVRMNSVKEIVNEQGQRIYAAFPNLEKLEINEMQSLENWDWKNSNEGDFSSLSHLIIEDCPKLVRFDVVSHLPSIRHFEIRNCPKLETLSDRKLPDSLEELIVDDCPPLQQRFVEGGDDWHKIEHVLNKSISEVDEDEWITDTLD